MKTTERLRGRKRSGENQKYKDGDDEKEKRDNGLKKKRRTRKKQKEKESRWNRNDENEETYRGRRKTGWKKRNLELMIKQFRRTIKENVNEEMTEWKRQI